MPQVLLLHSSWLPLLIGRQVFDATAGRRMINGSNHYD